MATTRSQQYTHTSCLSTYFELDNIISLGSSRFAKFISSCRTACGVNHFIIFSWRTRPSFFVIIPRFKSRRARILLSVRCSRLSSTKTYPIIFSHQNASGPRVFSFFQNLGRFGRRTKKNLHAGVLFSENDGVVYHSLPGYDRLVPSCDLADSTLGVVRKFSDEYQ